MDLQPVSGHNGTDEFEIAHLQQHIDLAVVAAVCLDDEGAQLRGALDEQDARHDGQTGHMALKIRLVDGNALDARRGLARLQRSDPLDHLEGRTLADAGVDLQKVHRLSPPSRTSV